MELLQQLVGEGRLRSWKGCGGRKSGGRKSLLDRDTTSYAEGLPIWTRATQWISLLSLWGLRTLQKNVKV